MPSRRAKISAALVPALVATAAGCSPGRFDPLEKAAASVGKTVNREASIPGVCYAKTAGGANACWTCHTIGVGPNPLVDTDIQVEYTFSPAALKNHWDNLFADRRAAIAAMSDADIFAYIRADNYTPLRKALAARRGYPGFVPDLDFAAGFD